MRRFRRLVASIRRRRLRCPNYNIARERRSAFYSPGKCLRYFGSACLHGFCRERRKVVETKRLKALDRFSFGSRRLFKDGFNNRFSILVSGEPCWKAQTMAWKPGDVF